MQENRIRIDSLEKYGVIPREELISLLSSYDDEDRAYAAQKARAISLRHFGNKVYFRGLIEISNYCKNDCYYCGIRKSNKNACRYRLTPEEILTCCRYGYEAGFRTFVLQGGEDLWWTDERVAALVSQIKENYPDCAVTLSLGEKDTESYRRLFAAGADRYLLRHETANEEHYRKLHPKELSLSHRIRCLETLKSLGYQTGAGFMTGSPGQTMETLIDDLEFLERLQPEMVGIGPFIPHHETPFKEAPQGDLERTLYLLSLIRLLLPRVLLPATTALGTIDPRGRERGILAGANVVMPNLSPENVREKYLLYDNKIHTGKEAAESLDLLKKSMKEIGYEIVTDRGDFLKK